MTQLVKLLDTKVETDFNTWSQYGGNRTSSCVLSLHFNMHAVAYIHTNTCRHKLMYKQNVPNNHTLKHQRTVFFLHLVDSQLSETKIIGNVSKGWKRE